MNSIEESEDGCGDCSGVELLCRKPQPCQVLDQYHRNGLVCGGGRSRAGSDLFLKRTVLHEDDTDSRHKDPRPCPQNASCYLKPLSPAAADDCAGSSSGFDPARRRLRPAAVIEEGNASFENLSSGDDHVVVVGANQKARDGRRVRAGVGGSALGMHRIRPLSDGGCCSPALPFGILKTKVRARWVGVAVAESTKLLRVFWEGVVRKMG